MDVSYLLEKKECHVMKENNTSYCKLISFDSKYDGRLVCSKIIQYDLIWLLSSLCL